jgi:hypothetical protein
LMPCSPVIVCGVTVLRPATCSPFNTPCRKALLPGPM